MAPISEEISLARQLGASEENWTRCTAGGTGIGIFGIALKQMIDTQHVILAAKAVCENHAILRAQVVAVDKSKSKPMFEVRSSWAPVVESMPWPENVDTKSTSGVLVLPKDDDEDRIISHALHQVVTNELNLPFQNNPNKMPESPPVDIFQIHVYLEPSKSKCHSIIILRFHSGACDRHSSAVVAQEFLTSLNAVVVGQSPQLAVSPDRDGLLPPMEDLIPKAKASKGFLKKGLDAVGYALNSSKSTLLPFQPGFASSTRQSTAFRSEILSYTLGKAGTEELLAACKRESTTTAAALSAAFLKSAANLKELKDKKQDTFSFTNVLSCRPYFEPPLEKTVVGNYAAGLPQDEQVKEGVSFWDLARHVTASTEKSLAKSHQFSELSVLNMLLSQVLKHPSITPSSSMRTALFTLFVDGPTKCTWSDVDNLKLAGTLGPLASMHFVGPCFSVAEALVEGPELCLTFIYTTPVHSRSQLESFLTSALELLKNQLST